MSTDWQQLLRRIVGFAFLLCVAATAGLAARKTITNLWLARTEKTAEQGKPAPDFDLKTLDEKNTGLKDFKDENLFIYFWADWCSACKSHLQDVEKMYKDSGFPAKVISIALDSDKRKIEDIVRERNLSFPILMDEDSATGAAYGIEAFPSVALIDKKGVLIFIHSGTGGNLRDEVERALSAGGAKTYNTDYKSAEFHRNEGDSLRDEKKYLEAMREYEMALEEDPNDEKSWHRMGHAAMEMGDYAAAKKAFSKLAELNPSHPCGKYSLAKISFDLGDYPNALRYSREMVEANPKNKATLAMSRIIEATAGAKPESDRHCRIGLKFQKEEKWMEAEREFRAALDIDPSHLGALLQLGFVLVEQNKRTEAREPLEKFLQIVPGYLSVYQNLAYVYFKSDEYEKCKKTCRAGLKLYPEDRYLKDLLNDAEVQLKKEKIAGKAADRETGPLNINKPSSNNSPTPGYKNY